MSWRAAMGACLGLLVAIPLAWLVHTFAFQSLLPSSPEAARLSPVLTIEERQGLSTYGRRCTSSADCDAPLGCLGDPRYRNRYCIDSQCEADAQCPEGQVCRGLKTLSAGPWVRRCVPLGVRSEGERCYALPPSQEHACRAGLLCAGEGWCGRPCRKGEPAPCPEGFFCADSENGSACLPTCESRGCPQGQECIQTGGDGASTCAVVHGSNCRRVPCPSGFWCESYLVPQRPGQAWMRCAQRCGQPESPSCPPSFICESGSCERSCSPEVSADCGAGLHCVTLPSSGHRVCKPEWYHTE